MSKRVAIIGAGPSGLVTTKELLENGHEPVCYERAAGLGGVFRFGEDDGMIWESCRLTSSGRLTAFSDFPASGARADQMTAGEYVAYLADYCEHFGVTPWIRFSSSVEHVRPHPDGGWQVSGVWGGEAFSKRFDAVAVCAGLHQHPHRPDLPGQYGFTGEIMHASEYRRGTQVEGRKVLVVGAGESGADIVAEVAEYAAETVLSLRRGVAVVSRRAFGVPRDYLTSRIMNAAAHWVFQTRNPVDDKKRTVYRWLGLPIVIVDKCLQILYRQVWENLPMFLEKRMEDVRANLGTRRLTLELLHESGGTVNEQFGTKDDGFLRSMAQGKCRRVVGISEIDGSTVRFTDGSEFQPDLVLLCTGFETRMSFLENQVAQSPRYLNTWNPDVGPSLGFVGYLRPAFGAIPPLAEMQARWFALVQSGELELPDRAEMLASMEEWMALRRHVFRAPGDRLEHLVDHTLFFDELARQVGCMPDADDLARESFRFRLRFWSGPFVAAQYRLVGPNAKPELARAQIEALPVSHPWPDLTNLYLRWSLCRMLQRLLGPDYAPKLSL